MRIEAQVAAVELQEMEHGAQVIVIKLYSNWRQSEELGAWLAQRGKGFSLSSLKLFGVVELRSSIGEAAL